jgi:beta-lactamase regulating signal transducer with metallopeptidase domain/tetratricopeptide (TPR) repeat protein
MNSLIEGLNVWGGRLVDVALPLLWQSSLLIAVVFVFDFLLRRKVRAAVRYSLWFVIFVKLLLPPTLALPTGAAWWLRSRPILAVVPHTRMVTVNYSEPVPAYTPPAMPPAPVTPPAPQLSREGWMLLIASAVSVLLAVWVLLRWRQIARCLRQTTEATAELAEMLTEVRRLAGWRKNVTLRVTAEAMSPAVCGLFRPVILLPQSLIEKLTASQLRAVLLHEFIHLRRHDVWVNCAQTLLQIVYWWHPLLWIANARVRRVREEAVDDAVMCALSAEAEVYAPTLLEVAKLAFARPLASLGLVGILESRSALRHRIERLLNFTTPRRAGVSVVSVICLAAFTALAVPMGEPPARPAAATDELATEKLIPYRAKVNSEVFTRNIQARAEGTMHATNDDLNDILVSIMDGFGVDCTGERAIQFNQATGVVTAKNTSEALGVLDEVVKELNLKGGEHVLNPPQGLKQVLIEGQFYLVKRNQTAKLQLTSVSFHQGGEMTPWWELSPADTKSFRRQLSDQGIEPMMLPRVQTWHGSMAAMFMGDGTNKIKLECVPYVHEGAVNFTVMVRTTGEYAPEGKGWPDIDGHTNCAIFSRLTLTNGGTAMFRVGPPGADADLVILLSAKILEPIVQTNVPALGDLPGVGRLFRNPANARSAPAPDGEMYTYSFRLDPENLAERLTKFAEAHNMKGITNHPVLLVTFLTNAGINTFPPNSFFLHEGLGRADLMLNATREDLQKAADALGLDWKTEQALNEGRSVESQKLHEDANGSGTTDTSVGHDDYKANFTADASVVAQLVQDGKLLYQLGRSDEAEVKLQEALARDPSNKAAVYYLGLIKQSRVRNLVEREEGGARNVPGPGAIPDDVTSVRRVQDEKGPADNGARTKLPVPNPNARTNMIFSSPQRQRIYETLTNIHFEKIAFPQMSLREVAQYLTKQTYERDPSQIGINFIINNERAPTNAQSAGAANLFDPTTGAPIPSASPNFDVTAVKIDLNPGLQNVRLLDVLQAITQSADHPIKYSLLDYGIVFSAKGPEQMQLHTRTFKVDAEKFYRAISNALTNSPNVGGPNRSLRYVTADSSTSDLQTAVVNFINTIGVDLKAPKSVFFNDRQGTLTVRATDEDLELIEQAINTLNVAPAQVTVKVRYVEISDEDVFKPGFEWFLGMLTKSPKAALTDITGILTDPQFRTLLKTLEQRKGVDLLNEFSVTTLSGRPAQIEVPAELIATNLFAQSVSVTNTLDIVPYVVADGYTVKLTLIPTETEFLGNYPSTNFISAGGIPITINLPLPRSRVRQMVINCIVWDGQTAVLMLKPYVAHQKNVVVFVTTTIIDPSGNRKHSDEDLGFAQKAVPPQPVH